MISFDMSDAVELSQLIAAEAAQAAARVEKAVVAQQMVILSRARADAPVGATGRLKQDIRPIGRSGLTRRVRAGKKRSFYSRFQEFGTSKMRASPFLLKQANPSSQAEFERRVSTALFLGPIYR